MKTVDFSKYTKGNYHPGSIIKRSVWHVVNHCIFKTWIPFPSFVKAFILRMFGCKCGTVVIKPGVNIKYPWFLEMGNNVWIGEGAWIDNLAKVTIGSSVCISQNALILTGNHNYKKTSFDLFVQQVTIEDGVWVGASVTVCPNTHLQKNVVITVGSVISGMTDEATIYKGNPAIAAGKRIIE